MKTEMKTELMTRRFLVGGLKFRAVPNNNNTGLLSVGYCEQMPGLALYVITPGSDESLADESQADDPEVTRNLWVIDGVSIEDQPVCQTSLSEAQEWARQEWLRWLGELRAMETVPAEAEGSN